MRKFVLLLCGCLLSGVFAQRTFAQVIPTRSIPLLRRLRWAPDIMSLTTRILFRFLGIRYRILSIRLFVLSLASHRKRTKIVLANAHSADLLAEFKRRLDQ